ncbi:MAG: hypothetical protein CVT68_00300 [Actinobacteria bacterium HGW-Actinobacteria-8]|nr:MAG: hypothetical protein CVT68_00300 [Actinobacteria bacterium HGW-Actinobacteria-8]
MHSTIQIAASLLILMPFILAQVGRLMPSSPAYIVLNLVGSIVLAIDALLGAQWGFLLLEGVWAIVSAISLVRWARGRRRFGAGPASPSRASRLP